MKSLIKRLWAAAPVATVILALAIAATGFFAVRTVAFSIYWHDPAHREQAIAGWMTPGFVARSWHVPREVVLDAVNAPVPPPKGPVNLKELAAMQGVPVTDLITATEAAIANFRAAEPTPGSPPTPPKPGEAPQ